MFFIIGINSGQKQAEYHNTHICNICGKYGRYQVFMTYTYLSFFFIPVLKWGKKYYAKTSCCEGSFLLNQEIGKRIFRGEELSIEETDLALIQSSVKRDYSRKGCRECGYQAQEDFDFCPKCGSRL